MAPRSTYLLEEIRRLESKLNILESKMTSQQAWYSHWADICQNIQNFQRDYLAARVRSAKRAARTKMRNAIAKRISHDKTRKMETMRPS